MLVLSAFCLVFVTTVNAADTVQLGPCTNHNDGFCTTLNTHACPAGWHWSYSGCGFLEKCCFPDPNQSASTVAPSGSFSGSQCGIAAVPSGLKIVGGEQTTIEAHPWQVSLRENNYHICGGSLISDRWVLTAAHCVEDVGAISHITILAGSTSSTRFHQSQIHRVSNILMHASYGHAEGHDIAMVKLSTPVDLSSRTTRKICLADPGDKFDGEVCVASGWGYMREDAHTVANLRHVALPIISNSLCDYYMYGVHDKIICAGRQQGGQDTCQGDSGGPLVCKGSDGSWKQAGLVSTGVGCARKNKFGFYTAVAQFRSWIQGVMDKY